MAGPRPTWPVGRLDFVVPGNPRPLQRPRFTGGHVYNPSGPDIRDWQRHAREHAPQRADGSPPPAVGAVAVEFEFAFGRPAGHRARKGLKPSAPVDHLSTPDVDNLSKLALDAMTGMFFGDDRQVVQLTARKRYAVPAEPPGTRVRVTYGTPGPTVAWPVAAGDPPDAGVAGEE